METNSNLNFNKNLSLPLEESISAFQKAVIAMREIVVHMPASWGRTEDMKPLQGYYADTGEPYICETYDIKWPYKSIIKHV